jgi:hypothetical protein
MAGACLDRACQSAVWPRFTLRALWTVSARCRLLCAPAAEEKTPPACETPSLRRRRCCVVLPLLPASARPTTKRLASIPRSFRRRQRCTALHCNTSPASAASISGTAPQKPSSPSRAKHAGPISLRLRQGARPRRGHRAAGSQDQHHV